MNPRKLLVVSGPTASGKTSLAVELALALDGEVVNIDSVQIFQDLDIGACKPSIAERKGVPHHLLDIRKATDKFNVAEFRDEASRAIDEIHSRGKLAIVAGGTTMYLTCLLHGLVALPAADPELRTALGRLSSVELFARLSAKDPETAMRLHPNDRRRVIRAIEESTQGKVPSEEIGGHAFREQCYSALILVLCPPREELYANINRRSHALVDRGIVNETRALRERYGTDIPSLHTIGYQEAGRVLEGSLKSEELVAAIAQSTRRLAKRQTTYWRNEPAKRGWECVPAQDANPIKGKVKPIAGRATCLRELAEEVKGELSCPRTRNQVWYLERVS